MIRLCYNVDVPTTVKETAMHKCPAILEHPFYPAWFQLAILVLESFFIGMIVGKFL